MSQLKKITLEDKAWIDPLVMAENSQSADFSFGSMIIWNEAFEQKVCQFEGRLITQVLTADGTFYAFPVGSGPLAPVMQELIRLAGEDHTPLRIYGATDPHKEWLEREMPGGFSFKAEEAFYDYIYDIDKLADLPGRKLHAKKNHTNKFMSLYPDWHFEPLTPAHFPECRKLLDAWDAQHEDSSGTTQGEAAAIARAFDYYEALKFTGGVLYAGGKLCAFTVGEKNTPDTMIVHFEKADTSFEGAYAMINREFAKYIRSAYPEIRYLNRCDDMGLESLRKSKHSYHPLYQIAKYTTTLKNEGEA